MKKLNLGCGTDILENFINIDMVKNKGVNKVINLNKYPYKIRSNTIDEIIAKDIIEHLDDPISFINELFRISKHGAKIRIKAPHFSSVSTWTDLTHQRGLSSMSLFPFDINEIDTSSLLCKNKPKFKIKTKIVFHKLQRLFLIEKLVNINKTTKYIYERFFAFIFQSAFVNFYLEVIKNE